MARRPSASKVIVVHGRQIVVDEAIDVNQLYRGGRSIELRQGSTKGFAGQVNEDRAEALATAEHAVTHGLAQPQRAGIGQGEASIQHALYSGLVLGHALGELGALGHRDRWLIARDRRRAAGQSTGRFIGPRSRPRRGAHLPAL